MWEPLTFCLLSALLTTGSALLCEVCESKEESCSGPLQPCDAWEESCVYGVTVWNFGTKTVRYVSKSCLEPENCKSGLFTFTYPHNMTAWSNVLCCDTDGCNTGIMPVPSVSHVPNGRQCPSCFTIGADRCEDMEPVACNGAENHCFYVAGTVKMGDMNLSHAAAGCCSPNCSILRAGVMKITKDSLALYTRVEHYSAPTTDGGIKEP